MKMYEGKKKLKEDSSKLKDGFYTLRYSTPKATRFFYVKNGNIFEFPRLVSYSDATENFELKAALTDSKGKSDMIDHIVQGYK